MRYLCWTPDRHEDEQLIVSILLSEPRPSLVSMVGIIPPAAWDAARPWGWWREGWAGITGWGNEVTMDGSVTLAGLDPGRETITPCCNSVTRNHKLWACALACGWLTLAVGWLWLVNLLCAGLPPVLGPPLHRYIWIY